MSHNFCLFGIRHLITVYCKIDGQPSKSLSFIANLNNRQNPTPIPPLFLSVGSLLYNHSAAKVLACHMFTPECSFISEKCSRIDVHVHFFDHLPFWYQTLCRFSQCMILRQPQYFLFSKKPRYQKPRLNPPLSPQKSVSEMKAISLNRWTGSFFS